jgi:hypothetical protein
LQIVGPSKSISHKEFYSWSLFLVILLIWLFGPTRTTIVYLVCVCFHSICVSCSSCSSCSSSSLPQISWIREDRATPKGSTPIKRASLQNLIQTNWCSRSPDIDLFVKKTHYARLIARYNLEIILSNHLLCMMGKML